MGSSKWKCLLITVSILIVVLVPTRADSTNENASSKIIIDHDGGADDAMAIFMALLYEKYFNGPKVIALTTVHGNVHEGQAFLNTQRILDIAERRDIPIYRGSNFSLVISAESDYFFGSDGLGDNEHEPIEAIEAQPLHAAQGIIELAKRYPGEINLVAIGAQTNIALATRLEPGLFSHLKQLYVGAGNVYDESNPDALLPEFNAEQDVESYRIVMEHATPDKVTILPFSEVETKNVTTQWRKNVLGAIPTKIMTEQNGFERCSIDYRKTWGLLDPIVMGAVLNDTIVSDIKYSQNDIILCGSQRGINTNNFTTIEEANVRMISEVIDEEYKNLLLSIFSAELEN